MPTQKQKTYRIDSDRFLVADSYRKKVNEWPKIPPNDGASLRRFSIFLLCFVTAIKEIKYLKARHDPNENQKMAHKLPRYLADRWSREVDGWLSYEEQDNNGSGSRYSKYEEEDPKREDNIP